MGLRYLLFKAYRNSAIKKHRLNYLFWETTLRCNLNCLHCGSDCTKQSDVKDMPLEDFVKVLDNVKENGITDLTVCITGGEPLLRKDIEKAGKEICARGYRWGIVTNALALTPDRFSSLLNSGLSSISFSIDGLEQKHNHLRQNSSSFRTVVNAIRMAVSVQKAIKYRLVFDVITCANKNNLSMLPELRDFLIANEVPMWRIFSIFPEGRGSTNKNELALNSDEYKQLMDFIADTRKNYGDRIHLNYSCEGYLGRYELKVRDFFFFCRAGINVGSVMCDGSVSACLSVRGKDFIQGNIYSENFMDIWNNKFLNMRDRSWAKKHKCAKCRQWSKCMGNGLHLHHNMTDEVHFCNYENTL